MTQTAIPTEFESYLQSKITAGGTPDLNQMIFAYIPGLNIDEDIDRETGLPSAEYWVHVQDVVQVSKLNENAVVYSVVVPSSVEAFTFNAIYLHDKNTANSCGMVVHKAEETKENGMTTTRTLVQQYNGAASLTDINVDAETWQIDYQARLLGIDEEHRLACLESYGQVAFIDGFEITQDSDPNQYIISPGVAYIGGLRVVLDVESVQTITTSTHLFLDVSRSGTTLSKWDNTLVISLSESELSDYIESTGLQHYVTKLASIDIEGNVTDAKMEVLGVFERRDKPTLSVTQTKYYKASDGTEGLQRDTVCDGGLTTREIWITLTTNDLNYGAVYETAIEFEGAIHIFVQATSTHNLTDAKGYQSGDYARLKLINAVDNGARDVTANFYICATYESAA